jgi:hypothetical protein
VKISLSNSVFHDNKQDKVVHKASMTIIPESKYQVTDEVLAKDWGCDNTQLSRPYSTLEMVIPDYKDKPTSQCSVCSKVPTQNVCNFEVTPFFR